MNYPQPIKKRPLNNPRLGIKSSLPNPRKLIALLYLIYVNSNKKATVNYLVDNPSDKSKATLPLDLAANIVYYIGKDEDYVDTLLSNPLVESQIEALQVALQLFFRLAKINTTIPGQSERTGGVRFPKTLDFSTNIDVLDIFLSSFSESQRNEFLISWLNESDDDVIAPKIKKLLVTFVEPTIFRITESDDNILDFDLFGMYESFIKKGATDIDYKGTVEPKGTSRVLGSYIRSGLHPFITQHGGVAEIDMDSAEDFKEYAKRVDTSLSIAPELDDYPFDSDVSETEKTIANTLVQQTAISSFLTAIRTKPFLLLAGISGTGKSRIVRKLAQATVTEDLQRKYTPSFTSSERWNLHSPANFELIQVKPNWHNSMDVVGYLSNIPSPHYVFTPFINFIIKAWLNPEVPFFLCVDEMNLAPVEEYFAEFLSAIESRGFENGEYITDPIIPPFETYGTFKDENGAEINISDLMLNTLLSDFKASDTNTPKGKLAEHLRKKGLTLPKNLVVIGTVNMDETTFSFSRKVLDRAMSIEMNTVNYSSFLNDATDDDIKSVVTSFENGEVVDNTGNPITLNQLLVDRHIQAKEIVDELGGSVEDSDAHFVIDYLERINTLLEGTPFKLGYRAANEALIYLRSAQEFGMIDKESALDKFTLMKILSRIEGDETKLKITDSEHDRRKLDQCGIDEDRATQHGALTVLTAMRAIIADQLGEYVATTIENQDETTENEESQAQTSSKEYRASIKKIDSMISQLDRDHFVSYWS